MRRVFAHLPALLIFPLYYGVLALLFFMAPLIPLLQGATLDYLVEPQASAWLYGVNIYTAIHGEWCLSFINHFWSLSVHEHFYFFWPLMVYLLARRPRALIPVCLAVSSYEPRESRPTLKQICATAELITVRTRTRQVLNRASSMRQRTYSAKTLM
jgi:hypothetical protein